MKNKVGNTQVSKVLKSETFQNQFTGFVLYNPATREYLYQRNADLYFTPASNVKILTTLACLESLADSIPTFSYHLYDDTLYLEPLGDPTLLHPDFPDQPVLTHLKNHPVSIRFPDETLQPFGPGWAWDDYQYDFQPQRSWMPLYGNEVRIIKQSALSIIPYFFTDYINLFVGEKPGDFIYREPKYNLFNIWMESEYSSFERKIPFDYSEELALSLLSDTLNRAIRRTDSVNFELYGTLYNQSTLRTVALMMQRSDNFLAEQLLIAAARKSGYRNIGAFRKALISQWTFLPSTPSWVDGSGLSRYNLITPKTLVSILNRMYETQSWDVIQSIFPTGGQSGTIKDWYSGDVPYVFAKTGTLSNNHSLSGYLKTKTGKTLIFSIMNNHYLGSSNDLKPEMQRLLETVRDRY